jgi:putative transposase
VWVYVVEDVTSQACLAASAGRRLSKERAAQALQEAHHFLRQGGIAASLVIQSDGGSEFTSEYFQQCCQAIRQWVRCRIDQAGDMGIVERLHRTFKYEFVFRHEVTTAVELKELAPRQRLLIDGAVLT